MELKELPEVKQLVEALQKEYGNILKSLVVVGSAARGEAGPKSDIDVWVILDDTAKELSPEEREAIDSRVEKIAEQISERLSIQPSYTLTEFFDYVRVGHPLIYNFIKEGVAVVGEEFFLPWKRLLQAGKIVGTREAIESYMEGAPKKLMRAKAVKLLMLAEDCYYAMLNTAQAVLMFLGISPPTPGKAYETVVEYLVKPGVLEPKYAEWLREIIELRKRIEHKEVLEVSGSLVDEWLRRAEEFVERMFTILGLLELRKRERIVQRTHEVMQKAVLTALKSLKKSAGPEELGQAFKAELIDKGTIDPWYWEVWQRVEQLKRMVDEQQVDKIPDKDVYQAREYVRKLIRELASALKY